MTAFDSSFGLHRFTLSQLIGGSICTALLLCGAGYSEVQGQESLALSAFVPRGTDNHSMVFNSAGDLFFLGWNAALEKAPAALLPNPETDLALLSMQVYLVLFQPGSVPGLRAGQ